MINQNSLIRWGATAIVAFSCLRPAAAAGVVEEIARMPADKRPTEEADGRAEKEAADEKNIRKNSG